MAPFFFAGSSGQPSASIASGLPLRTPPVCRFECLRSAASNASGLPLRSSPAVRFECLRLSASNASGLPLRSPPVCRSDRLRPSASIASGLPLRSPPACRSDRLRSAAPIAPPGSEIVGEGSRHGTREVISAPMVGNVVERSEEFVDIERGDQLQPG